MRVFLHLKDKNSNSWSNMSCDWERIPNKGDIFALGSTEPNYKVVCVQYPMFSGREYDIEIYAIETTLEEELSSL